MVRVDYFSKEIEATKRNMMNRAKEILLEKTKNYEDILTVALDTNIRQMSDNYTVMMPQELYQSYQAYSSSSLKMKKSAEVKQTTMSKTHYYQPIVDKDFDFVLNPVIMQPVIQVMYTVKLKISVDHKPQVVTKVVEKEVIQTEKEYILVTPEGAIKALP